MITTQLRVSIVIEVIIGTLENQFQEEIFMFRYFYRTALHLDCVICVKGLRKSFFDLH